MDDTALIDALAALKATDMRQAEQIAALQADFAAVGPVLTWAAAEQQQDAAARTKWQGIKSGVRTRLVNMLWMPPTIAVSVASTLAVQHFHLLGI